MREQVHKYRLAHENGIVAEFARLLSIPNLASDTPNIERNAQAIATMLKNRGVGVELLRIPEAPPIVYGRLSAPRVRPTVGIYAHYDGQPVDSSQWQSPPFSPVLKNVAGRTVDWKTQNHYDPESRIYARSAGDDKAAIAAIMTALDALSSVNEHLSVNVKFLFDGEEESGSPNLAEILSKYPDAQCPAGKRLTYLGVNPRNRNHIYRATQKRCRECVHKSQCTTGHYRQIAIHVHEAARQRARERATVPTFAAAQRQRRKVEALFAELKNQIGLRRVRLRRIKHVREQFFLAATAQNLKRLARFLRSRPPESATVPI